MFATCGGPHAGSRSDTPGSFEQKRSALSASTTMSQAVTGRIVAPPGVPAGGQISASTAGTADVDDGGNAWYSIPIWVPDGVNGTRPSISLAYNSAPDSVPGGGLLGPKWSLSGLSTITRCGRNLARDQLKRPVDFKGDTFCLDGTLLIRATGSLGGTGRFQTEVNPFQKIMATQTDGTVVLSFQVFQPDGQIYFYGSSANSRLSVNDAAGDYIYSYHLDKIEDRYGNSILVTYRQDACCFAQNETQELYPASITWGATGDTVGLRSIQFSYQPLTAYNPLQYLRSVEGHQIASGERLTGLQIYGPDATGAAALLKQYVLGYLTPSITKQRLLSSITECDGNNVCKRPTQIVWDPGSVSYTKLSQGITDIALANLPTGSVGGHLFSQSNIYRRILAADLNNDGLDDIIYRQLVKVTTGTTTTTNLGWVVRYNTSSSRASISFGQPVALGGATLVDPSPGSAYPYSGDPYFADVNGDGYPDMFMPNGDNNRVSFDYPYSGNVRFKGYTAFTTTGPNTSTFAALDDATIVDTTSPWISIGDVTGNGFPEIIRPRLDKGLHWRTVGLSGPQNFWWPPLKGDVATMGISIAGFQIFDMDGDGTAEIARDLPMTNGVPSTLITSSSSTTSETISNLPPINPQTPPQLSRMLLDMNGDGIPDVAWVNSGSTNLYGILSTGSSFGIGASFMTPVQTTLPATSSYAVGQSWLDNYENGVRVVDFNQDGRDDLMLVDNGATATGLSRTNVVVLVSNGDGSFTPTATSIPVGQPADGPESVDPTDCFSTGKQGVCKNTPASHGYRTTTVADVNGDGLPDLLQLEGNPLSLQVYMRQGNKPDMVTMVREGTGRELDFTYLPVTDHSMYTPDMNACTPTADPLRRLSCLVKGRWLTRLLTEKGLEANGVSVSNQKSYTYTGGLADRFGRGFLGFESRTIQASNSRHIAITYSPSHLGPFHPTDPTYMFPLAFKPQTITTDTDTPQGPNGHHQRVEKMVYQIWGFGSPLSLSKCTTFLSQKTTTDYDCPANGVGGCATGSSLRTLSSQLETFSPTAYGAETNHTTYHYSAAGTVLETDVEATTVMPPDLTNWLVRTPTQVQETSATPTETVTRTRNMTPDLTVNAITGLAVGVNQSVEYEPTGDVSTHRIVTYGRDTRGRVTSVSDAVSFVPQPMCVSSCNASCNATCSHNCGTDSSCLSACTTSCVNGCLPSCPPTPQVVRNTTIQFLDADGVYPSTTTDAAGHTSRTWRHPGLGLITEVDDVNNLPTVLTYDTFGRPQSTVAPSGASTTMSYGDGSDPLAIGGVDMAILPEGSSTREISVHLDSFGRETNRVLPIDAAQSMAIQTVYDSFGRVQQKNVLSGGPTSQTTPVNGYVYTYDDLNRQISDCHIAGDLARHCTTNNYDGLKVTVTDESGRATTRIGDEMGRVTRVQAAPLNDAAFSYGPFSALEHESVDDFSGQTDRVYDVLGRVTSVTRRNVGARTIAYNAYGEVTQTAKAAAGTTAPLSDVLSYGRDALGRMKFLLGPGINRTLTWDKNADGTPAANALGKLVETLDSGVNHEQFTYNANGQLQTESWTLSLFGQAAQNFGQVGYFYDGQGRLQYEQFPGNLPGSYVPLELVYTYDPYMGKVATIADNVDTAHPKWSASQRNAIGGVSVEALRSLSGVSMSRTNTYNLATGQLGSAMLTGPTQSESLTYAYQPDGLPQSFGMNGVGGFWAATFDYDALKRLTTWVPSPGVNVSYSYDADGNITGRNWGTTFPVGNISYAWFSNPGGRSLTVSGTTSTGVLSESYQMDLWGRIFDTPGVTLTYNANDEVTGVVEKTNGAQTDAIIRDGLGARVATTYGSLSGAHSYLLTLMNNAYEFKYSSATNTTEERYRYFADGKLVGDVVRLAANQFKKDTFYLTDNVGSVVAEAADTGAVTARARRDPYGNLLANPHTPDLPLDPSGSNPDGTSRLGFGGFEREANWGLVDASARFYSPGLGFFITPDALMVASTDRRSYNPLAYCDDNPMAMVDTNGHAPRAIATQLIASANGAGGVVGSYSGGGGNPGSTQSGPVSTGGISGGGPTGAAPGQGMGVTSPGSGEGNHAFLNAGGAPGNGQSEFTAQSPVNSGLNGTTGSNAGDFDRTQVGTVSPMEAATGISFWAGLVLPELEAVGVAMEILGAIQGNDNGGLFLTAQELAMHDALEAAPPLIRMMMTLSFYAAGKYNDSVREEASDSGAAAGEASQTSGEAASEMSTEGANITASQPPSDDPTPPICDGPPADTSGPGNSDNGPPPGWSPPSDEPPPGSEEPQDPMDE